MGVDTMWTKMWINQFDKNTQKRHYLTKNIAKQKDRTRENYSRKYGLSCVSILYFAGIKIVQF